MEPFGLTLMENIHEGNDVENHLAVMMIVA